MDYRHQIYTMKYFLYSFEIVVNFHVMNLNS